MSSLEELPVRLREYRDLKDEIARLEKEAKELAEGLKQDVKQFKAYDAGSAYRVPGVDGNLAIETFVGESTRESIGVREARVLLDPATLKKLLREGVTETLYVREVKDE